MAKTKRTAAKKIPACAASMGCLCAGHARGNSVDAPCDTNEGYNGWKNYETWAVALWIDNEEGSYNAARITARECAEQAKRDGGKHVGRTADGLLADKLKTWIEEQAPDLGGTLWADLLGAALSEVDWYEIAHNMQGE